MRLFCKLACLNVHSGSGGLLHHLGLNEDQQEDTLLADPSTHGLGDPIQNAAYSLLQTASCFLTYDSNMDYLVAIKIMFQLETDFFEAVDQIINDRNNGESQADP